MWTGYHLAPKKKPPAIQPNSSRKNTTCFHAAIAVDLFDGSSDQHHPFPLLFLDFLDLGGISGRISGGISGGVAAGIDPGHREELLEGLILLCQVGVR